MNTNISIPKEGIHIRATVIITPNTTDIIILRGSDI
jgi:hypothetical protein